MYSKGRVIERRRSRLDEILNSLLHSTNGCNSQKGLLCGWQGPRCLGLLPLMSQIHQQQAGLEAKLMGLELVLQCKTAYPTATATPAQIILYFLFLPFLPLYWPPTISCFLLCCRLQLENNFSSLFFLCFFSHYQLSFISWILNF